MMPASAHCDDRLLFARNIMPFKPHLEALVRGRHDDAQV